MNRRVFFYIFIYLRRVHIFRRIAFDDVCNRGLIRQKILPKACVFSGGNAFGDRTDITHLLKTHIQKMLRHLYAAVIMVDKDRMESFHPLRNHGNRKVDSPVRSSALFHRYRNRDNPVRFPLF